MPAKAQTYAELAERSVVQITGDLTCWLAFLRTVGCNYKYSFRDLVMIYAQRPEATACADYDFWKYDMRRFVRAGTSGIALLRRQGGKNILTYVFDISDTGAMPNAVPVHLWEYNDDTYGATVAARLTKVFGVPSCRSVPEQLIRVALGLAETCWHDHKYHVMRVLSGSLLEELDEDNLRLRFTRTLAASLSYVLLSRCDLTVTDCFTQEDFQYLGEFNTCLSAAVLGGAVRDCSELVLHQIERAIRAYHRTGPQPEAKPQTPPMPDLSKETEKPQETEGYQL